MSGIYVHFDPCGLAPTAAADFERRVRERAVRPAAARLETGANTCCAAAAVHHGHFPSGGVAGGVGGGLVAVSGACWIGAGAAALASPAALLADLPTGALSAQARYGGTFALAWCDEAARRLVVITDRQGSHPMYVRVDGGAVRVASEIRFLVEPGRDRPDEDALAEYLAMGFLGRDRTLVEGIRRIHAHQRLVADEGGVRIETLPRPEIRADRTVDDDVVDEMDALVKAYFARHAAGVERFSVSFSGGLDSRLVAGAAKEAGLPLQGFTCGERGSLEVKTAHRAAAALGLPLAAQRIDAATMPSWFGAGVWLTEGRVGAEHMHYIGTNVAGLLPPGPQIHGLVGEGIIGGYDCDPALRSAPAEQRWKTADKGVKSLIYWPEGRRAAILAPALAASADGARDRLAADARARLWDTAANPDAADFLFRAVSVPFRVPNLVSQVSPWTDVISPFLDGDLVDFAATLDPLGMQDRALQIRWGLRCIPGFDRAPRLKDGVLIPVRLGIPDAYDRGIAAVVRRRRRAYKLCRLTRGLVNLPDRVSFPHYGQWYRSQRGVRRFVDGILLGERTLDRGLWRREGLARLLHDLRIGRNAWQAVGVVLVAELFLRQFVDGADRPANPVDPVIRG